MAEFSDRIRSMFGIGSSHVSQEPAFPSREPIELSLLPWDVRYALNHRGGMIERDEIEQLARNPAYTEAAFYLSARALRDSPEKQRVHLQRHADNLLHFGEDRGRLVDDLIASMDAIPGGMKVDATKLAEISRQGPKLRAEAYGELAKGIKGENRQPVLVAHAALEGLHTFLPAFSHLQVISPHWFGREGFPIGYSIDVQDGDVAVSFLQDKSQLPADAVFVDDTLSHGGTRDTVNAFIGAPTDFRVINKVSG